ncbi:MAG: pyrroline-5-carboxylate reductase [Clostridiales bacterium]|jgi:pyrroline-5-carboxylate reductase|nr:pyrroline-5-carboxylate reductase [Clostridiales bacterium]
MTYGFIGCGAMAGSIVKGCLDSGFFSAQDCVVYDKDADLLKSREDSFGIRAAADAKELIEASDVVFLGVKPISLPQLLKNAGEFIKAKGCLLVSIAGGQTLYKLRGMLGFDAPIIRVMPNINCAIGEGAAALCANEAVATEQKKLILDLFSSIGSAMELDESLFSAFTAIAGCSPAFVYLFADSLARAGVLLGMSKKQALEAAACAISGSARNIALSGMHPWALIDSVCSPGGSTIEGIAALISLGFENSIIKAVEACAEKDKRMSENS